jgi:hypothetical protein
MRLSGEGDPYSGERKRSKYWGVKTIEVCYIYNEIYQILFEKWGRSGDRGLRKSNRAGELDQWTLYATIETTLYN